MKIGVLIPKSKIYPQIGFDFINGLRLATKDFPNLELHAEGIDFGAKDEVIIDKTQKLLFKHQLHAMIGLGGLTVRKTLEDVAKVSQIPVLIADTGGYVDCEEKNPLVFINSLEFCKSSWLMGIHLGKKGYKNIGITSSFYDAGYQFIHAFSQGISTAKISPVFTYVLPYDPVPEDKQNLSNHISAHKPEAIFGALSHDYAHNFLSYLDELTQIKDMPVYGFSTICSEDILEKLDKDISITNVTSWTPELDREANKEFLSTYEEMFYKQANLFAMLGYENGKALVHAAKLIESENPSPKMLADALRKVDFEGPRSKFSYNEKLQRYDASHWLTETTYKDKKYDNRMIEEINADPEQELVLEKTTKSLGMSGWLNPYLCI